MSFICPTLLTLTQHFQADAYGGHAAPHQGSHTETFEQVIQELKSRIPFYQRLFGVFNLVGWLKTR